MSCFDNNNLVVTSTNPTVVSSTIAVSTQIPSLLETLAALQFPIGASIPSTSTTVFQFPQALPPPRVIPPITIDPIPVQPSILPPSSMLSNLSPTSLTPSLATLLSATTTASNRRSSCPETVSNQLLDVPSINERRRYSDGYTVDALLRDAYVPITASYLQQFSADITAPTMRRASVTTRKQRTIYGSKQTEVLEEAFHSQKYMVGAERELLANRLGLSESQVRVWFQNRRSKHRKLSRFEQQQNQQQPQGPSSSQDQQ